MQFLFVIAILSFTRSSSVEGCGFYTFPDNIKEKECESGLKFSCADGYEMDIVATCVGGIWHNEPSCVHVKPDEPEPVCVPKMDLVFVIDGSSSIGQNKFYKIVDAIMAAFPSLNIGPSSVHVGGIVFSWKIYGTVDLNGDLVQVDSDFWALDYPDQGGTRTDKGINEAKKCFERDGRYGVQQTMVVITDGESTNRQKTINAAIKAHNYGINMYAVGIGYYVDYAELNEIASSSDNVFLFESAAAFEANLKKVIDAVCSK
ncbi:hypothetical protein LOTGIDRAFT_155294 [Lottia gigantea]|uniref:VWFA domain-containing protein n=1 Tax=Lottia gigantea TaxID=225164 RepID=V4B646_LOTGI|nr:hypothetical protein LOTGIDRAFT_155294 [Lottia gigantea]ESO83984.1 hypothetical protein LOTGIDRAFT_155294 [Lottia gigantea]